MAFPNEIQVGRYNGILHKLLGMKEGAPSPMLDGSVIPALVLENDRVEWRFLGGERLMFGRTVRAATAAQVAWSQIFNPAASQVIVVIQRCLASSSSTTAMLYGYATQQASAGGSQTKSYRDTRFSTLANAGTGVLGTNTAAATVIDGPITGDVYTLANTPVEIITEGNRVVLSPGFGFIVETANQNVPLRVAWSWTERYLEPSEER